MPSHISAGGRRQWCHGRRSVGGDVGIDGLRLRRVFVSPHFASGFVLGGDGTGGAWMCKLYREGVEGRGGSRVHAGIAPILVVAHQRSQHLTVGRDQVGRRPRNRLRLGQRVVATDIDGGHTGRLRRWGILRVASSRSQRVGRSPRNSLNTAVLSPQGLVPLPPLFRQDLTV